MKLAYISILAGLGCVQAGDRDLPVDWSAKKIKWVADLGTQTYGNPAVSGGRVFIGTNNDKPRDPAVQGDRGVLMCFSESDGKFLWQATHEKLPGGDAEDFAKIGICSTPFVAGDRVYYVSNRAELVCRDARDGKVVWLLDMRKDLGVSLHQASACSPLVAGGLVFAVTGQGSDVESRKVKNPAAPSFIAANAATGKVVWQDASPGERIIAAQWGSPAYGVVAGQAQVAFPGGDGWLYVFEPETGKPIWKFNCKAHEKVEADGKPETNNHLTATPVYINDRILIATGQDTETSGPPGCLRAIDARKGIELWRLEGEEFGRSISSVACHEGLVYAAELDGYLSCVELSTGKRLWRHDLKSTVWGSPLVADAKVYIRTGDGDTLVFAAGREVKLLATNTLPDVTHGTVVAAGGVLYLAGDSKLYAVTR